MFRTLAAALCMLMAVPAALAETALRRLDTGDDGRGWEAVGRLDIDGRGFCTGALIAPDLVLTAAHCLFDRRTGARIDPAKIEFLAGWRNGRATAYRGVRRAVVHSEYVFRDAVSPERVRTDLALLELHHPIDTLRATPFHTDARPSAGQRIGIVSYARDRADAPSLQEFCDVIALQEGVLVMSCDVDFGASGAPVFSFETGEPRVVSVVSAMAEVGGRKVSLGTPLHEPFDDLLGALEAGEGFNVPAAPRMAVPGERRETGAKFARPGGS